MPPTIAPELGNIAPVILEDVARRHRSYSDAAFARHLGIDATLIAHWRSGRRAMPVEVLPLLARYLGDPEAVYGDLLARAGMRLVTDDEAGGVRPIRALRGVRRHIGRLLERAEDATDPEGPEGEAITPEEARELLQEAEVLQQELRVLVAGLRPAAASRRGA